MIKLPLRLIYNFQAFAEFLLLILVIFAFSLEFIISFIFCLKLDIFQIYGLKFSKTLNCD